MASNPLYNTNDSPNNATQPAKAVNDSQVFVNRNRNTFDLSYFNYKTQRFGQYEPFFVMEGVPGDTIPLSSSHNVRSLPMQSPFLSSLTLSKDYFMIPMQAILPNTWEMIFSNPASGDDVPADANCLWNFFNIILLLGRDLSNLSNVSKLKLAFVLESIFSSSSLPSQLGYCMQDTTNDKSTSFDFCFNNFISFIATPETSVTFTFPDNTTKTLSVSSVPKSVFCDFLRQNYIYLTNFTGIINLSDFEIWYNAHKSFLTTWSSIYLNMSRILAYQLCCKQFYVNTKIDPIYNSQLYRDNFFFLLQQVATASDSPSLVYQSFTRNGISVPYDFFSRHYFSVITNALSKQTITDNIIGAIADVYFYVFSFNRVLKFGDYFTSCRTQPLGTDVNGEMNAPVVGDKVAAIDMSKSIVMQRFLNNVVKLGNDFGEYLRGIFGREPSPDYHFPKFISHQEFDVSGFEVANSTETGQGSMVTNLKSGSDKYAFEVTIDMPCILLGISNFNCPRLYGNARPRFLFHKDRFDMFNPMLQYIGDQPVHRIELNTDSEGANEVFGYNSRNSEYKQAFSVASGGFLYELPSWSFIADFGPEYAAIPRQNQGPEFLRVYPFEFDRFFASLSGTSLSQAFHFIVVYNNKVMASRPMAVNPSIL